MERQYYATVEEVRSGDDFTLLVDLGVDGLYKRTRARLKGVETPNAFKSKPGTVAGNVRDTVKELVGNKCLITLVAEGRGGWIVELFVLFKDDRPPKSLNELLIDMGFIYRPQAVEQT